MPQFTFYAHPIATAPDRVQLAIDEAGFTDYERITVDIPNKEQKTPEYLARNPFGKVPTIVTSDGITMYESRGIARYLCTRYNFDLLPNPNDNAAVALFEQEYSCETACFDTPVSTVLFESAFKPLLGLETDPASLEKNRKALSEYLDVAESIFSKTGKKFWAGDKFTLVDINYIVPLARMFERGQGDVITSRPALKAWWDRCNERPAIKAFIAKVPNVDELMAQFKQKAEEKQ
ncbi:hypothetical protein H112_08854 [Trichophyton rubrum D6]|uniref:glutathione transferase n=4 Tax=Trichophyton TaxID=5550 RepID=A0A178ERK3_TRIRU|nr:uncharacterized protein TERG_01405 [Trichophyton rubrum CBS 118892]EZF09831.1 hypothetical protein H100_08875 [Trichophyton rubrum MR850]EZF36693.1 hypothetical protein H102_08836 [Trichophyton rubrum CBS 100081]EZF47285.1 hypothetical protein H103_08858 [Trichophyton rubrum CBS 288.86]EZF58023.1 hypothetical protein H104_08806 [Trichophyton rubrum CBS 289.86]EZF68528.1 hypothetical protein H105_08861 [Trichophyton soudanense CBS 452.61]EZF79241.1 hypothetical protein H110_08859 [Trichophy